MSLPWLSSWVGCSQTRWQRIGRHISGAEAPFPAGWGPKAKALGYLKSEGGCKSNDNRNRRSLRDDKQRDKTETRATTEADPYGMTNKGTSKGNNNDNCGRKLVLGIDLWNGAELFGCGARCGESIDTLSVWQVLRLRLSP
jgi:hypothetical protein